MVEWKKLGDCLDFEQPTAYLVKSTEYDDSYDTPVLTAGQSLLLGYTNETKGIYRASKANPTIIFDDFTTSFHWIDFDFKVKSSAMKMLRPKKDVNFRYVYYSMCGISFVPGGHQRHWISKYSQFEIPIPTLSEQNRIVGILDTFTASIENLKQQIAERRKQYEYYRDQLLDLEGNTTRHELMELCDYVDYRGKTPCKVDSGIFLVTAKNIRKGYIDYENSKEYISKDDYEVVMHRGKPQIGDVLITTEAPCGNVAQVDNDSIALAQRVIKYRPKDNRLLAGYLKYVLLGKDFQMRLDKEATGATAKGIKGSKLHKMTIPVPSLIEQSRIVSILDTFEASIANLEAQLKQREKQYEYYRNKLLTFE